MTEALLDVVWAGSSLKDLKGFPDKARAEFGYSLYTLQRGKKPSSGKPMTDIGMGVFELLEQDARAWYRVIYYTRLKGKIVVLHCFEKKTNKTNINDIELAKKRLKEILKGR